MIQNFDAGRRVSVRMKDVIRGFYGVGGLNLRCSWSMCLHKNVWDMSRWFRADQGYGRGGTPIFTDVFEPLARVALYPTDADGLGTCFDAA